MAARQHVNTLWREAGKMRLARLPQIWAPQPYNSTYRVRQFNSQSSPILRNASTSASASSSSSTVDAVASQSSEASAHIMAPLTPFMDQLPELLHLPPSAHSYAISIVILTVVLRTCITLPVSLWQRARMRRMEELVAPRWEKLKIELPILVAKRSRKEKKSYAEYEKALQRELKLQIKALTNEHRCNPTFSFAIPLIVHLPLFISLSLLIRTSLLVSGSPISLETIPWWSPPADLQAKFEASAMILAERGIEGEALQKLTKIEGPTLAEVDKTMFGPISLGILTMANVELGQWVRRGMKSEKEVEAQKEEKYLKAQLDEQRGKKQQVDVQLSPFRDSNVIGNALRALAVGFVAISSQTPAGVVVYWLTSTSYTIIQNSVFAYLDSKRHKGRERKDKEEVW